MNSINRLALSRIRHNKSTSILTVIAMVLTTCLLMTLGTGVLGITKSNQQYLEQNGGNHHAAADRVTQEQIDILARHLDVESLNIREHAASVVHGKLNASLIHNAELRPGINTPGLVEGAYPQAVDEITAAPLFFERMGAEPVVGGQVTVAYRIRGEGEIVTTTFTIAGLLEQVDMSALDVMETRIAYAAFVSQAFVEQWGGEGQRDRVAFYRVTGQDSLTSSQLEEKILAVAADAGIQEEWVDINRAYLMWTSGMDTDTLVGTVLIALLIVLFCALILYSIYYVSVITNIQELGKLRALGASRRQMKRLLLREGMLLAAVSIPPGLVLGYLLAYFGSSFLFGTLAKQQGMEITGMLSLPVVLVVIAVVLGTVILSLLRPMRIAARISPMEAIRYQEQSAGEKAERKGFETVTLFRLSRANLGRNRRRSVVTILTLSVGCVLFMVVASVLTAMQAEDLAKRALPKGDFKLEYIYSLDDRTYLENNLNEIQQENPLGPDVVERIEAIPGVAGVERILQVMADINHEGYNQDISVITLTAITRQDFQEVLRDWRRGERDYDRLVEQKGIAFNWDSFFDYYGFALGQEIPLTLKLGENTVEWTPTLEGSGNSTIGSNFLVPIETIAPFLDGIDATTGLYIDVEPAYYDSVKAALTALSEEDIRFRMYAMDEEMAIAEYSMQFILLIAYAFLLILGIISFMNLINTMVTSIVTRRRELGLLQAVGLGSRQMSRMLSREGMVFTLGALAIALTAGSGLGYLAFQWAKGSGFMDIHTYRYPLVEAMVMTAALIAGQLLITFILGRLARRESIIQRIQV